MAENLKYLPSVSRPAGDSQTEPYYCVSIMILSILGHLLTGGMIRRVKPRGLPDDKLKYLACRIPINWNDMRKFHIFLLLFTIIISCAERQSSDKLSEENVQAELFIENTSLIILGTMQDAGSPHIACVRECCTDLFDNPTTQRQVVSLGLIDAENNKTYLFEATPDIARQMKRLTKYGNNGEGELVDGIFLTHAHIGHYTGLMYLGKEAMGAQNMPVYAMPRMKEFLEGNGPWDQLVSLNNIRLYAMKNEEPVKLSGHIEVTPFLVPHRNEYSETVGFKIQGPTKTALFIPDINKWEIWDKDIVEEIKKVDYAFLDATFFSGKELGHRDISQIPHPFIIESFETFEGLSEKDKNKVVFIHFNHTNPVLNPESEEAQMVLERGFRMANIDDVFEL
jgi:pyrroloquinoline quinone biosynthesis protein B